MAAIVDDDAITDELRKTNGLLLDLINSIDSLREEVFVPLSEIARQLAAMANR